MTNDITKQMRRITQEEVAASENDFAIANIQADALVDLCEISRTPISVDDIMHRCGVRLEESGRFEVTQRGDNWQVGVCRDTDPQTKAFMALGMLKRIFDE